MHLDWNFRTGIIVATAAVGLTYWAGVASLERVAEAWDATRYWTIWYPVSVLISGIGGAVVGSRSWYVGAVITSMQLPIMIIHNGKVPLIVLSVVALMMLSIPAMAASAMGGRLFR